MLVHYDNLGYRNWATGIRENLFLNGFGYVWEAQCVNHPKLFLIQYLNRLKDQYMQIWRSRCETNKKLSLYLQYKTTFTKETYVSLINIAKFRSLFASFRGSSHSLSIETGRHHGIERDNRICPYCDCYVEDEYHFVMICPLYNNIRSNYIRNYFTANPSVEEFCSLMSSNDKDLHNLAM